MPNKSALLLSLEDPKTRKIANIIGNESCIKILDHLSNKSSTISELAENLQIPISTVHYNIQQLTEAGLIKSEEFHYSEKGKEVNHYKLANRYIIITPKKVFGIKEKLRSILPIALICGTTAIVIQLIVNLPISQVKSAMKEEIAETISPLVSEKIPTIAPKAVPLLQQNIALWFLFGALFALGVYVVWTSLRKSID